MLTASSHEGKQASQVVPVILPNRMSVVAWTPAWRLSSLASCAS